jgi:Tfp pilus assembly protein PilO
MSRRSLYMLSGAGLVALVALFWFFALSPVLDEIEQTEANIASEHQELRAAQARLAQMEQFRVQAKRNESRLIELSKMVPLDPAVPSLILQIQDLAVESGIDFLTLSPSVTTEAPGVSGAATASPGYQVVTLNLSMSGRFFDINDFIYRAEQMAAGPGRLLRTDSVSLKPAAETKAGSSPKLDAEITMHAYTRIAGSPVAAPAIDAPGDSAPVTPAPAGEGTQANTNSSAG